MNLPRLDARPPATDPIGRPNPADQDEAGAHGGEFERILGAGRRAFQGASNAIGAYADDRPAVGDGQARHSPLPTDVSLPTPGSAQTQSETAQQPHALRFDDLNLFRSVNLANELKAGATPSVDVPAPAPDLEAHATTSRAPSPLDPSFGNALASDRTDGPLVLQTQASPSKRASPTGHGLRAIGAPISTNLDPLSETTTPAPSLRAAKPAGPLSSGRPAPVFVAFHAGDGAFSVVARAGRMAPTERTKLRHALGALLAEYGILDATLRINGEGETQWPK